MQSKSEVAERVAATPPSQWVSVPPPPSRPDHAKNALVLANKGQRSRAVWFILILENLPKK
jgi:hypothetical protein